MDKKILFVKRDDGGCGHFRCVQPAAFLKRSGLADTEVVLQNPTKEQLFSADLVVMQEMGSVIASNLVKFMIENKIPFMSEFDDFIQHVSPRNFEGYGAWNPSTLYTHRAMEQARVSIGLTVSTSQLAREYFPYNQTIFVVPNYLDMEKWENALVKRQDNKIRIGWCGGNAHADDLKMISKVLDKIVKKYKNQVVFETIGMTRQELAGVFPMKIFNEVCPSCGYEGEIHHFPGENINDYPLVLASRGWDIALAPVVNNAFGNCKSDLKIKEYAAAGIPIIASSIVPYLEAAESNAQLLFANTFDEWYNAMIKLISNPAKRDEMSKANKEWISKRWIQDNIFDIYKIYESMIFKAEAAFGKKVNRLQVKK